MICGVFHIKNEYSNIGCCLRYGEHQIMQLQWREIRKYAFGQVL